LTALPPDVLIRVAGEDQAFRRAGPWPQGGSFAMRMAAAERATIQARRTGDILIRFNQRYRFWEHPDAWERAAPLLDRLAARRAMAIAIAEQRASILLPLLDDIPAPISDLGRIILIEDDGLIREALLAGELDDVADGCPG
jgi:hypothetical protein